MEAWHTEIQSRDYQTRAEDAIVSCREGIIKAPAGSGKTIIGAKALARWAAPRARLSRRRMRVACRANTIEQTEQWKKAFAHFPEIAEACDLTIGCYAAGASVQAADLAIFDECHHIAGLEFRKILDGFAGWRWGFSATPHREDDLAQDVYELLGPIVCEITREEVQEVGGIVEAKVLIHQPNRAKEMEQAVRLLAQPMFEERARKMRAYLKGAWDDKEQMSRCVWQCLQDIAIVENAARNKAIVDIASQHAEASLIILIGRVDHGTALAARIPGSVVVHSGMTRKGSTSPERPQGWTRKEALTAFSAGEIRTIFATSLADEGLDVPRANALIMAAAGRSAAKAEQRTGRVLRTFHDKTHGTIHDFMDIQHYFIAAQSKQRIATYRQLGYAVTFAIEKARP